MQIQQKLLTKNQYSRPGARMGQVKNVVVHWVGNANTTAINNRNYFESLKTKKIYASSHYIVGLEGEVIQCVPENEVAYHANQANSYSIGVECCHPDWDGKFNDKTYQSVIELCVDICKRYKLDPQKALIRHYDVTKKQCPLYYVQHQDAWQKLKYDVSVALKGKDQELEEAVKKIVQSGIKLDVDSWSSQERINLKNVPALLTRLGGLEQLVTRKIISSRELWSQGRYNTNHVRSLLIKYAKAI